jgi:LPS export ABC transporter permease LptG
MRKRRLIERYIFAAIVPYTLLSLVLLTAILFLQQTGRYTELIFHSVVPPGFVYNLSLALLPSVVVFTLPLAVLAGTIIGFGRMGSDSEVVAMRAAGTGTWKMLWPALLLGALATAGATYLNLKEAPQAQHLLLRVGIEAALYKLDSPVEPRSFTTEIPGNVIYVRDGNKAEGKWGRVFIFSQQREQTRLITAQSGRIDSSADKSELVLQNAVMTTLPQDGAAQDSSYIVEHLSQLRLAFNTGRGELITKLQHPKPAPDEMEWGQLRAFLAQATGKDKLDAQTAFHKRLTFSISPLVFALFGAALALRVRRGSRGFGVLLTLIVLIGYYLVALAGEQMARAGTLSPLAGSWLATTLLFAAGIVLLIWRRIQIGAWLRPRASAAAATAPSIAGSKSRVRLQLRRWLIGFTLLDKDILRGLGLSFLLGFVGLVAIFNVFTLFELWRFITWNRSGMMLVAQYLFYLFPLVCVELSPGSVLVAALITYALNARRSEAIAWWASGQSVYRLMAPGLLFAMAIAGGIWFVQERAMPAANIRQDDLRARIRNIAQVTSSSGRRWLASTNGARIYSYEFDDRSQQLVRPVIYDFDQSATNLVRVTRGAEAKWINPSTLQIGDARLLDVGGNQITREAAPQVDINDADPPSVFRPTTARPSQLSSSNLSSYVKALKQRGADTAILAVALQRKYTEPFTVVVMALLGMPLAVSFGRKSAVLALCSAVAVSLSFWLVTGGFQQLGEHGLLPPAVAAWAPIAIFAGSGLYFISRVRT